MTTSGEDGTPPWRAEADERLAMVLHDWWWNEPLVGDEDWPTEDDAIQDMRSLIAHLHEHDYSIVPVSKVPNGDSDG